MEVLQHCPICNAEKFEEKLECIDYTTTKEKFKIVECTQCQCQFTNPRPDITTIGKYYNSDEYISHSDESTGIIGKLYKKVREKQVITKIALINKSNPNKTKKILDIGCGRGFFLQHCKEDGWEIAGMEPDEKTRALTEQALDIPIFENIANIPTDYKADIISMWHVLEHVHDLDTLIKKIVGMLDTNGTLIVAVPNRLSFDAAIFEEYWSPYDVPRHLYHFRQEDIANLFQKYDLSLVETVGMKYDSYYAAMLSNKYRYGNSKLFRSFIQGLNSNIKAEKTTNYSSNIYLLKK